jgi:acyl-[acyl-carrier-protein]-phospholipid O-acyltransferase / long-chain-fatty-acid--[acyl-carrier-protein] ligase
MPENHQVPTNSGNSAGDRSSSSLKVFGHKNLPPEGFLLVPNRFLPEDFSLLKRVLRRPIAYFAGGGGFAAHPEIARQQGVTNLSGLSSPELADRLSAKIRLGTIACWIPDSKPARPGTLIYPSFTATQLNSLRELPVFPIWIDRLWGSLWRTKKSVRAAIGRRLESRDYSLAQLHQRFLELGELCFGERSGLDDHLGRATIRGLRSNQFAEVVVDGMDGRKMKGGTLLAAGIALSQWLGKNCPGRRVAVVLPPGIGAIIANIGVLLANKIPVNLNFTAGRAALASAIQRGEIAHAISAKPVMKRLQEFPWPATVFRLEELVPQLKPKIALWRLLVLACPAELLGTILRIPRKGGPDEAVLLFTSGTAGEPKGVVLSHRNIVANVLQFRSAVGLHQGDTLMASLPFFHCFGCTVTLWHPVMEGIRTVTYPTPVDVVKNAELVERYRVTLLTTTPTFLRGYLKRCEPKQFSSLRLLIAGAEKLPRDLAEAFEQKFQIPILEGYGLTETSPVVSVNLPHPVEKPVDKAKIIPSSRPGSVGKLLPGQAAQIRDPDTGRQLEPNELGMLWLKGPNVFESYLNEPRWTAELKQKGWFRTGDLARFDEDGFLYIEGRLSRFSKIAGEMVPHETLEAKICDLFGWNGEDERILTVVGVPDETKGESLVLLTTRELSPKTVREKMLAAGFPTLWIPRTVKRIAEIPILGTGKLNLAKCREVAAATEKDSPRRTPGTRS